MGPRLSTGVPFSFVFGPELQDRLWWFAWLRWFAVAGLFAASLVGSALGFDSFWPSLFIVGMAIGVYNAVLQMTLARWSRTEAPFSKLQGVAIAQMCIDLTALTVAVHFTGGLHSPLLVFYAFHMAIGTIILPTRLMYWIAGATLLALTGVWVLERWGPLAEHPIEAGTVFSLEAALLSLGTAGAALFGVVYLTHTVSSRFKARSVELYETGERLRERAAELKRLLRELEEVERRKSHYMRISAHQLRSPLATLKTSLKVVADGIVDPASERGERMINGAMDRTDDLLLIVNDLLELAKIREGGEAAPWTEKVIVNQLLADLFDTLQPMAEQRAVELVSDVQGVAILDWGVPPDLLGAFENLIHNAIKYSRPGGTVTVRLRIEGEMATVEIQDQGIGIPEDKRDEIFLEFVRTPEGRHHAEAGTGLGLSIAREAVRLHGGTIYVASRVGEGTTFTVTLPLHGSPRSGSWAGLVDRGDMETLRVTER